LQAPEDKSLPLFQFVNNIFISGREITRKHVEEGEGHRSTTLPNRMSRKEPASIPKAIKFLVGGSSG
jgi:hypothetical protein